MAKRYGEHNNIATIFEKDSVLSAKLNEKTGEWKTHKVLNAEVESVRIIREATEDVTRSKHIAIVLGLIRPNGKRLSVKVPLRALSSVRSFRKALLDSDVDMMLSASFRNIDELQSFQLALSEHPNCMYVDMYPYSGITKINGERMFVDKNGHFLREIRS